MDHLAIIGGGCAGLALGAELANIARPDRRVTIYDDREHYGHDRTWCYWAVTDHPYRSLERYRWHRWRVRNGGREQICSSELYPYCLLPSGLYYREAMRRIEAAPGVSLRHPATVEKMEMGADAWHIHLADGEVQYAERVVNTLPSLNRPRGRTVGLIQHFAGQYITVDRPVFDPDVVTLMDFDVDQSRGIHFLYLLPLQADIAYVVDTYITDTLFDDELYRANIRHWLRERYGVVRFHIEGEELGAIPMELQPPVRRQGSECIHLGSAGGAIKRSSGYAFTAIQRQAAAYVESVEKSDCWTTVPAARPGLLDRLDRIFLSHMIDHPQEMPAIFMRLFERCEPDALVRFLSDCPTRSDLLQVLTAAPAPAMTATALRRLSRWLP